MGSAEVKVLERKSISVWTLGWMLVAALVLQAAPSAAQSPAFLVFHSPTDNGVPSPDVRPALVPAALPIGVSVPINVWLENFNPGGPVGSDPLEVCVSALGTDVCGWHVLVAGNNVRIDSFVRDDPESMSMNLAQDGSTLSVAGGSATGQNAPVRLGQMMVTGLGPNGVLESRPGSWVNAAGALQSQAVQLIAATVDTCGNGTVEPPEQCDDGNDVNGDGCYETCILESSIEVSGTANGGSLDLQFAERGGPPIQVTTIQGQSADTVAASIESVMNGDSELQAAQRSADKVMTAKLVTDAEPTLADSNDSGLTINAMPEPGSLVQLLSGLGLLWFLDRRRSAA
jgi:cysteine-rich repeat protein